MAEHAMGYRFVHDWFQLPDGFPLGNCHGLAVDGRGHVFLLQQNGNPSYPAVLEFSSEGRYLGGWGNSFARGGHGLLLTRSREEEHLWVVDSETRVVVRCQLDGTELQRLPVPAHPIYASGTAYLPTDVAVAPDGRIFVSDGYGGFLIHVYAPDGSWITSFGGPGTGPGQFNCPHGLAIDAGGSEPRLVVADRRNIRLQLFDLAGNHQETITGRGLRYPCSVRFSGDAILIPDLFGALHIWDRNYQPRATPGLHPDMQPGVFPKHLDGFPNLPVAERTPGIFISPHTAVGDARGRIFIGEWILDGGRLTMLEPL